MPKLLSINIGFITNSSSVVYHFPRQLLEHPDVAAFLKAFQVENGLVGEELWSRSHCTSILMTKEQKLEARQKLAGSEYCTPPGINTESDDVVVIFGDEYESIASSLATLMQEVAALQGGTPIYGDDYN